MDPDTAIGGHGDRFPSTRLSLLEASAAGFSNEALERVIAIYWKPIYRFIRVKFHKNNEDAKDLTQAFFATAIEHDFLPALILKKLRSERIFGWRSSVLQLTSTLPQTG